MVRNAEVKGIAGALSGSYVCKWRNREDRYVKADLATASIRGKKVHQFHTNLKYFSGRRLLDESRRLAMDRHASDTFDRAALLYGFGFMADSDL